MKFASWVVKYRWPVIALTFVVLLASSYGLKYLGFNNDNRVFFSSDNPQLLALEELENTYNKLDAVFIVIEPEDGTVFTRSTLGAIEALTEAAWKTPYSVRVDSITNFQHTRVDGDDLMVAPLVDGAAGLSDADIEYIKEVALGEPLLVNQLVSPSGHTTGIFVSAILPTTMDAVPEVAAFTRKLAKEFKEQNPGINVYLSGGIMFDNGYGELSLNDMKTLVPIMLALMVVVIFIAFVSIHATIATVVVIVASALTGLGLAGWFGLEINVASSIAPVIILTLAIADSVHLLSTMYYEMAGGKSRREAIAESIRVNLYAIFLTSVTTAIGFLSMNSSDAPPFRDLGNIVAAGVMAAFFYSILLLPALMAVLPARARTRAPCCSGFAEHFGAFVVKRRRELFVGMAAFMLLLAFGVTRIELDDSFIQYFDESLTIRSDTEFMTDNLTGIDVIEYSLSSGEPSGINEPRFLEKVEEFTRWWRARPEVRHVYSLGDIVKRLNRNMHADDPAYYRIPDNRELAAQYLLLYELSLPFGLDLNNRINVDKSATRLTVTFDQVSTARLREIEGEGAAWLEENWGDWLGAELPRATGISLMWAHISERNIDGMLGGTGIALLLISGILILALRSLKLGLISLIPNLAPAFMAFGLWGLIVGKVGLAVSIISALSLGIVVDDTVHLLTKYQRARRELNMDATEAILYSFRTVGMAIMATSMILAVGFMVLTFSKFGMNSSMGLLTAIAIGFALMADLLFLPPLLIWMESGRDAATEETVKSDNTGGASLGEGSD